MEIRAAGFQAALPLPTPANSHRPLVEKPTGQSGQAVRTGRADGDGPAADALATAICHAGHAGRIEAVATAGRVEVGAR